MTDTAAPAPAPGAPSALVSAAPLLFGVTVFTSAALIFLVEPMIAKLVLPTLGGSPAVWNTCMAFFQAALLIGYLYAHLLQRIRSIAVQTAVHAVVLVLAALALPLRVTDLLGEPSSTMPALWLMGVLAISLGAPFAALSATAPLAQAWYARVRTGHADAANPYVLYVGSNFGSLIALLAYPLIVEPALRLKVQAMSWSMGYGAFVALMLLVAFIATRAGRAAPVMTVSSGAEAATHPVTWWDRLKWIGLAAVPSSLMLGVTTYVTTDIASAPFLWVAPLALYLLTFIIAFSNRRFIPREILLIFQAAVLVAVAFSLNFSIKYLLAQVGLHLVCFFLTALMCHQALADRKPHPSRLTEFYLCLSIGGVIGGGFNAFAAPLIFNGVWEYPLALILACLARPWGRGRPTPLEVGLFAGALVFVGLAVTFSYFYFKGSFNVFNAGMIAKLLFLPGLAAAFLLRDRAVAFMVLAAVIVLGAPRLAPTENVISRDRSFFGVLELTWSAIPNYSDKVRMLAHGTTLHGAQAEGPERCVPTTYYAPGTPIGQVFLRSGALHRNLTVGAVGMGAGTVAAYTRPDDELMFFEIDPLVKKIATNPDNFTFINGCAAGRISVEIGDARLTVAKQPKDVFDILLVDAFSSDAVPTHLLTVEAMRDYLSHMRADGVVIMHLSNRHLDLVRPVAAVAKAAGGFALTQRTSPPADMPQLKESPAEVIIVGRTPEALAPYVNDPAWQPAEADGVAPWTDDYTNLVSAIYRATFP